MSDSAWFSRDGTGVLLRYVRLTFQNGVFQEDATLLELRVMFEPGNMHDDPNWLNPGDSIYVGDRKLVSVRPPLFDSPTTIGIYDSKSEAYFSVDCFGGIIPSKATTVDEISEDELAEGMISWASGDSPWIYMVEQSVFSKALYSIRLIAPKLLLSAHLPPAQGKTEKFLDSLRSLPASPPFVAPNQASLEQILAQAN